MALEYYFKSVFTQRKSFYLFKDQISPILPLNVIMLIPVLTMIFFPNLDFFFFFHLFVFVIPLLGVPNKALRVF